MKVFFYFFRKITIHDTSPELFRMFLEYLYGGNIEMNELSTEQIADMMTLADRYDVSLYSNILLYEQVDDPVVFLCFFAFDFFRFCFVIRFFHFRHNGQ